MGIKVELFRKAVFLTIMTVAIAAVIGTPVFAADPLPPVLPTELDLNLLNLDGTNIDPGLLLTIDYLDSNLDPLSMNSVDNPGDGTSGTVFWGIYLGKSNVYSLVPAKDGTDINITVEGYEMLNITAVEDGVVVGDYYLTNVTPIPPTTTTTTVPTTTTTTTSTSTTTSTTTTTTTTTTTIPTTTTTTIPSPSGPTPINSCTTINSPGVYVLNQDISSYISTCIRITSSNVIFDGQGYIIDGKGIFGSYDTYVSNRFFNLHYDVMPIIPSSISGIHAHGTSTSHLTNITVKNVTVMGWSFGIDYRNVENGNIKDNTASNNDWGIRLSSSSNTTIIDNTANSNRGYGIIFVSHDNTMTGNTITGNTVSNNGAGVGAGIAPWSSDNLIYNNLFNNSNNFGVGRFIHTNDWNISKTFATNIGRGQRNHPHHGGHPGNTIDTPSTNIVGGLYLGGNFWAKPDGTGFSETCIDKNWNGICDSGYTLASDNVDYLPLSLNYRETHGKMHGKRGERHSR